MDLLVEVNKFLHPLHGLHTGVTFFDDLRRHVPTWLLLLCLTSDNTAARATGY